MDLALRRLAQDWEYQRYYNQHHLYFVPGHIKPALIRLIGAAGDHSVSLADLKIILTPSAEVLEDGELAGEIANSNREVTCLDLAGSVGKSIQLKELADLLYPSSSNAATQSDDEPEESWDTAAEASPALPRALLPNLTHISLAVGPLQSASDASWKQLLSLAARMSSSITHLSLAFWPSPCLTPRSRHATVSSPQQGGRSIPYGGTNMYSHALDDDWSEALLVLRMLSRHLYELEFLDLTGCGTWFRSLTLASGHDRVDWAGDWGKIRQLRLFAGWTPGADAMPSEVVAHAEVLETAAAVERHIITTRAGKGRFITVDRDRPGL